MLDTIQQFDNIDKIKLSGRGIENALTRINGPERGAIMKTLKISFKKAIRWIEYQFSQKLLTRLLRPTRF